MGDPGLTPETLHDFCMSSGIPILQNNADKLLELGVSAKTLLRDGIAAQLVSQGGASPIAASDIVDTFRQLFQPGPVAVFWDYDRVPAGGRGSAVFDVPTLHAVNAVRDRLSIWGPIHIFQMYVAQDSLDDRHAVTLTDTGATLVSVPRVRKRDKMEAFADKPVIADALIWAYQELERQKSRNLLHAVANLVSKNNNNNNTGSSNNHVNPDGAAAATAMASSTSSSSSQSVNVSAQTPVVVIVSDDPDFAPLLSKLKNLGVRSVVVTRDDAAGRLVHGCANATLSFPSSFLPYFATAPSSPQRRAMGGLPRHNQQQQQQQLQSPKRVNYSNNYNYYGGSSNRGAGSISPGKHGGGGGGGGKGRRSSSHGRHRNNNHHQQQQQHTHDGRSPNQQQQQTTPSKRRESPQIGATKPPLAPPPPHQPPPPDTEKTFPGLPTETPAVIVEDASPSPAKQQQQKQRDNSKAAAGSSQQHQQRRLSTGSTASTTSTTKFIPLTPHRNRSGKGKGGDPSNPLAKLGIKWRPILAGMDFAASPTTSTSPQFKLPPAENQEQQQQQQQQDQDQQQQQHRDPSQEQDNNNNNSSSQRFGSLADLLSEDTAATDLDKLEVILQQLHNATGGGELSRAQVAIEIRNVLGNVDLSALLARAEAAGIVQTGGKGWNAWVSLARHHSYNDNDDYVGDDVDETDLPTLVAIADDASPEQQQQKSGASPAAAAAAAAAGAQSTSASPSPSRRQRPRHSASPLSHEQCWMSFRVNADLPASEVVLSFDDRLLPDGVGVVEFDVTTQRDSSPTPYVIRAFGPWPDGKAAEEFARLHFSGLPYRPRYYARPPEEANAKMFSNQL